MEAKLIVIGGKANKSEVKLKLPTTIGRSRKADLTVAHPKVSRQHCEIFEREGLLMVRDFGSLNGTFIENNRVSEAVLKPGDKLTVGPLTFVAVYEQIGALPSPMPDPHDLPTPGIGAIELPPFMANVGRAGETVAATPIMPADRDAPRPPAPPAVAESATLAEVDLPQPATIRADAQDEAVEDFDWLAGQVVSEPPKVEVPPAAETPPMPPTSRADEPSPALAETVNLKWLESQAPQVDETDKFPFSEIAAAPVAEDEPSDALSNPPPGDAQDFSWLDNAKDQPLDFSAFERGDDAGSEASLENASNGASQPTMETSEPAVSLPERDVPEEPPDKLRDELPPTLIVTNETPAPIEEQLDEPIEDKLPAIDPLPPESEAPEEPSLPDFAAMARAAETEEPAESEFPSIVSDRPASVASSKTPAPRTAPADKSTKKGWWPFGGKKGDKKPPAAAKERKSPAPAVQDDAEAASAAPPPASAPPAAPPAAPQFVMPPLEEPEAAEAPQAADASDNSNEDDALGQFFKSLQ